MPRLNDRQLLQRVRMQLNRCAGWDADAISQQREDAMNYYLQRARGDEVDGRSRVVSGDLSAMTEANLAQMMTSLTSDTIAEFASYGESDAEQARLESATVEHFIMGEQNGFLKLAECIKDALLLRNGFARAEVLEETRTDTKQYVVRARSDAEAELAVGLIQEPGATESKLLSFEDGVATVRHTYVDRSFEWESVAPENMLYLKSWTSLDMARIPVCAERHLELRSDLVKRFPKSKAKIAKLKAYKRDDKPEGRMRDPERYIRETEAIDKSAEEIEWFSAFVMYDSDGDGIAERHRLAVAGQELNSLLDDTIVSRVIFCTGTAIVMPHRLTGISLYDKLRQIQDKTTGLERAGLDNVNANNRNKVFAMEGVVNQDDLDDGRINNNVRVDGSRVDDVRKAAMPAPINDLTEGILRHLDYQSRKRAEMGGAALDLQTASMQLNERIGSEGIDRAYSVAEQLAALFMQLIAASLVRNLFLLVHATLREHWAEPVQVQVDGKWIYQTPSEWPERRACTVKLGKSPGERSRRSAVLEKGLSWQVQLASAGLEDVLVDANTFYRNLIDFYRINEIPNPERYWIDPESDRSKQAMQRIRESQARDQQARRALMRQAVSLEQLRTAEEHFQHVTELQFKYWRETLLAEIKEADIAGRATVELIKAKETPDGDQSSTTHNPPSASTRANGKGNGRDSQSPG